MANTWTDPDTGLTWTYTISNGEASLGGGSRGATAVFKNTKGPLAIPSRLDGYPVAGIDWCAFEDCNSLTSVTIPESVKSIERMAFRSC